MDMWNENLEIEHRESAMTVERILGSLWLHSRRLIDAFLEASAFALAAGLSLEVVRANGVEIVGQVLDPAKFFLAPTAFLAARLIFAEARRQSSGSLHVGPSILAGAALPLLCLGLIRGLELVAAYVPIPADILDESFWGAWMLIPIGVAAVLFLGESNARLRRLPWLA